MTRRSARRTAAGGSAWGPGSPGYPAEPPRSIGFAVNDNRPSPLQRVRGVVRIVISLVTAAGAALFLLGN